MPAYLLRVEGVNLAQFVQDTDDLSTTRGGSLLLLEGVRRGEPGLEPISVGASIGLYRFDAADDNAARDMRTAVADALCRGQLLHATFVVDVQPYEEGFVTERERVLARNRWRQLASPSLAIPSGTSDAVCAVDCVRPAVDAIDRHGERIRVSASVRERRAFGVGAKHGQFYEGHVRDPELGSRLPGFARDFSDIAESDRRDGLAGKMALLYVDGNGFTRIQDEYLAGGDASHPPEARQRDFDRFLQEHRSRFLESLLRHVVSEEGGAEDWIRNADGVGGAPGGRVRLETLLWGGDEFALVLPAWQGWATLCRFFGNADTWCLPAAADGGAGVLLTHAAALVLCAHNAPIQRVYALARQLVDDVVKPDLPPGAPESRVAYQVLESFDHVGLDLEGHLARELPPGVPRRALCLPVSREGDAGGALRDLVEGVRLLRGSDGLARRQVKMMARRGLAVHASAATGSDEARERPQESGPPRGEAVDAFREAADAVLAAAGPAARDAFSSFSEALGRPVCNAHPAMPWLHLDRLWDYVPAESDDAG